MGGAYRAGVTLPRRGEMIGTGSQLFSEAWSFDLARRNTFAAGDSLGFRISQPLRVISGGIDFELPVAYDYATETPIIGRQRLTLSPDGREIMGEFSWGSPLFFGYTRASAFYRSEPGHVASAPDDIGALVSFSATF